MENTFYYQVNNITFISNTKQVTLGDKVKAYRKRACLSQLQLELMTDLSEGSICRIESNSINPTKETILRLSKALKLSREEIIDLFGI